MRRDIYVPFKQTREREQIQQSRLRPECGVAEGVNHTVRTHTPSSTEENNVGLERCVAKKMDGRAPPHVRCVINLNSRDFLWILSVLQSFLGVGPVILKNSSVAGTIQNSLEFSNNSCANS